MDNNKDLPRDYWKYNSMAPFHLYLIDANGDGLFLDAVIGSTVPAVGDCFAIKNGESVETYSVANVIHGASKDPSGQGLVMVTSVYITIDANNPKKQSRIPNFPVFTPSNN